MTLVKCNQSTHAAPCFQKHRLKDELLGARLGLLGHPARSLGTSTLNNRQVPTSAQNETFVTKNKFDLHGRGFGQAKRLVAAHHTSLP